MAYTIKNVYQLQLIEFLTLLGVLQDFDQFIETKTGFFRVTFKDDKIKLWSTLNSTP